MKAIEHKNEQEKRDFFCFLNDKQKSLALILVLAAIMSGALFIFYARDNFSLAQLENNAPQINLVSPAGGAVIVEGSPVNFTANSSDADNDEIRTEIFVDVSEEDLALEKNLVCNAMDNGVSAINCTTPTLPLPEDNDRVLYYKFDNDFLVNEDYKFYGYDIPFNTEPLGCQYIYNFAASGYDVQNSCASGHSGCTNSVGTQDCAHDFNRKWIVGKVGQALSFDGKNDYVEVADADSLDLTGEFTVDFWFWPREENISTNYGYRNQIFRKGADSGDPSYQFYYASTTSFCLPKIGDTPQCISFLDDIFDLQSWNHVVALLGDGQLKAYVNGASAAVPVNVLSSKIAPSNQNLIIGNLLGGAKSSSNPLEGALDEFHIYSRALTEAEIVQSFSDGSRGVASTVSSNSHVLYFSFDNTAGDSAEDSSAYDNDGILRNFRQIEYVAGGGKYGGSLDFLGITPGVQYDEIVWVNGWDSDPEWAPGGTKDLTEDFTVSAWVKPQGPNEGVAYNVIYNRRFFKPITDYSNHSDVGFFEVSGNLQLYLRVHDISCYRSGNFTTLGDFEVGDSDERLGGAESGIINSADFDKWHHVVATYHYNEETGHGEMHLYLNGQPVARHLSAVGPLCNKDGIAMQVGGNWWRHWKYSNYPFNGELDDIAVYKRALTNEEVENIYNNDFDQRCYYWKGVVYDGVETAESEARQFCFNSYPTVTSVDTPADNACLNADNLRLAATVSDPDTYGDEAVQGVFDITPIGEASVNTGSGLGSSVNVTEGSPSGATACAVENGCLRDLGEGSYQWRVKAKDSYGWESDYYAGTRTFELDLTAPENASVQINDGGAGTPDLTVVLTLNAADARHNEGMQIRITGDVDPADPNYNIWQDYIEELEVELTGGTGEKIITVEFKDGCGNISIAEAETGYSTPPAVVSLDERACFNTLTPALKATLSDQDTGDEVYGFFNILPAGSHEGTGNSTAFDVTLNQKEGQVSCGAAGNCLTALDEGTYQWQVKAVDHYGLESDWSELWSFDVDVTAPSDLSVIINSGQAQTMQREVVVAVGASDAHSEGLQVKFSGDIDQGYPYYNVWQARQDFFNLTLTDGYGLKTITVEFQDDCGNIISYEDYIERGGLPPIGGGGPGPYIYYGDLPYAYDLQPANNESWGGDEETYNDMIFSWRFADPNDLYQQQSFQIGAFRVADDSAVYESGSWAANSEASYNEALDRYYYSVNDISGLAIGGQYYWRVKVKDTSNGVSDWSSQAYFYTNHRPGGYALDWPAEGESIASANPSLTISLGEDFDNDAIFYKFEIYGIANAGDEAGELVETSEWQEVNVPPYAYTVTNSLVEGWYRWRVYAKDEHDLPSTPEYLSSHFQISNPPPVNQPPAAVIDYTGPLYILAGESASLDGTSSYDPEFCQSGDKETAGACLLYQWYVNGALASREESFVLQTAPDISQMYQIVLMVQDLGGRYSDYGGSCVGYDHWVCLSSLINVGYCGDFISQAERGEACDAAYDSESKEKISGDDLACPGLCQESCLCPAELDLPKWREVRPF